MSEDEKGGRAIPPELQERANQIDEGLEGVVELGQQQPEGPREYPYSEAAAGMIGMVAAGTFGVVAKKRGKHWALSAGEANEIGKCTAQAIQHYFPNFDFGPGMAMFFAVAGPVAVRAAQDAKIAAESKRASRDNNSPDEPEKRQKQPRKRAKKEREVVDEPQLWSPEMEVQNDQ